MALKQIDLTGKCGSCDHFRQIDGTATGECLQNPYNDSVVHDPKHPYWIVQRSRIKCPLYNAKPHTNADRIRAMSDEELADCIYQDVLGVACRTRQKRNEGCSEYVCRDCLLEWLKQPAEEDHDEP